MSGVPDRSAWRVPPRGAVLCAGVLVLAVSCTSSSSASRPLAPSVGPSRSAAAPTGTAGSGGSGSSGSSLSRGSGGTDTGGPVRSGGQVLSSTPRRGGGTVVYTGAVSGTARFASSSCAVRGGGLVSLDAPDRSVDAAPSATLALDHAGGRWEATFALDRSHRYTGGNAVGVTAARHGRVWVVTLSGTALAAAAGGSGTVTLDGILACGRIHGA